MADFNIKIVEIPESSPDRARLIKSLTEGEGNPETESAEDAFNFIKGIAHEHMHHAIRFGTEDLYIWPMSLGVDPIKAFEGMVL